MTRLVLLAIACLFTSCITFQKCADKFGTGATHTTTVRDSVEVEIPTLVPGDSLSGSVPCDSLVAGGDSVRHVSESDNLEVIFWRNKYNRLLYKATKKPDTIKVKETVFVEVKGDCPDTVILDPEEGAPAWHRWLNGYKNFSAWALLFLVILFVLYLRWNR